VAVSGLAGPASAADLPNAVSLEQWADVGSNWVTGSLGLNGQGASAYVEGDSVPFRLNVTSAGPGTFDFSVCRDYDGGTTRGYLSLMPYSTSRTPLLSGLLVTEAATGPAQPFTGGALVGGVSIDAVNELGNAGTCGAGQRETQVRITISAGPLGVDPVGAFVLWGGRLASPADAGVGAGNGASQFPGASLSMRLGGSAKNVGIKTEAIIQLATVSVKKVVESGSATPDQFCFILAPNPNGVTMPACPPAGGDTVAFVGLPTGTYAVTEAGVAGYSFASGTGTNCTFAAGKGSAPVAIGNTPTDATCEFHNRRQTGTLTVNQVVDPGTDPGRFNLEIDGATAGTGADVGHGGTTGPITVSSGGHAVGSTGGTGTDIADYTTTVSCVDGNGPVTLSAGQVSVADGQNVVCTVTVTPKVVVDPDPTTTTTTVVVDPDPTTTTTTTVVVDPDPTTTTTTTTVVVDPDPTTTTTTSPVVDPQGDPDPTTTTTTIDPSVDPNGDDDPDCDRVRASRGGPGCGDDSDVIVDPDLGIDDDTTTAAPVVDPGTTVAGGGEQAATPAPVVLSGEVDRAAPPAENPLSSGGFLPRTGTGIGSEVTLAFGLVAAGLALLRLARRRKPAQQL
jgi:LPXTG-motif cell wall-anchored protein